MTEKRKPSGYEPRNFTLDEVRVEYRASGSGKKLVGHAAVFNALSEDLGGFREKIDPGAFKPAIRKSDTRALLEHDPRYVLGRKSARTLKLKEDREGLHVTIYPPDTQWANDLMVSIERGDVDTMSFGFTVKEDRWEDDKKDGAIRTLVRLDKLIDVSVVSFPAYPDTSVASRSMQAWQEEKEKTLQAILEEEQKASEPTLRVRLLKKKLKLKEKEHSIVKEGT